MHKLWDNFFKTIINNYVNLPDFEKKLNVDNKNLITRLYFFQNKRKINDLILNKTNSIYSCKKTSKKTDFPSFLGTKNHKKIKIILFNAV